MKNKITAPKKTTIKGQPHELAYINDAEQGLLMALGGAGKPVHGILAYYDEGDGMESSGGDQSAGADGRQGSPDGGDREGGNQDFNKAVQDAANKAKANLEKSLAAQDRAIEAEIANRQAYEATMRGISPGQATAMFGDARMAGRGFTSADIDRVLGNATVSRAALAGMLPELQERARRGQQISTLAGALSPLTTAITGVFGIPQSRTSYDDLSTLLGMPGSRIQPGGFLAPEAVLAAPTGGVGAFGTPANLSQGYFGQVTYTGMPNEEYTGAYANLVNPRDPDMGGEGATMDKVKPANPLTGTCEPGYTFDDDLQACRLDTGSSDGDTSTDGNFGDDDLTYYRPTILDTPSQFDPDPQRFTDMNNAFIDTFAYNPAIYDKKMDITGFAPTPTSGLLG